MSQKSGRCFQDRKQWAGTSPLRVRNMQDGRKQKVLQNMTRIFQKNVDISTSVVYTARS